MGEEWGSRRPFLFFCDLGEELRPAVCEGRRREFAGFPEFADPDARALIPDPTAVETFVRSKLDWTEPHAASHAEILDLTRRVLAIRHREIVPRLPGMRGGRSRILGTGDRTLAVRWILGDGARLTLLANLGAAAAPAEAFPNPAGRLLFATNAAYESGLDDALPPWSVAFFLDEPSVEA